MFDVIDDEKVEDEKKEDSFIFDVSNDGDEKNEKNDSYDYIDN